LKKNNDKFSKIAILCKTLLQNYPICYPQSRSANRKCKSNFINLIFLKVHSVFLGCGQDTAALVGAYFLEVGYKKLKEEVRFLKTKLLSETDLYLKKRCLAFLAQLGQVCCGSEHCAGS
jgi:hypothetical protein